MDYKRLTLLVGHYGSGKTNIAVNMAHEQKRLFDRVTVADLDIVNPYYRTKDSEAEFRESGIRLICSDFANSNVDLPSMPADLYSITDDKDMQVILDIGGDDRGALALGRLAPMIIEENDYDMLLVINKFRPLTPDAESTVEIMGEIEAACRIPFTGLINNSNLGDETTAEDIIRSVEYANDVSKLTGLPVVMTTCDERLYDELRGKVDALLPMKLQQRPI